MSTDGNAPTARFRHPAEWERHDAVWAAWPPNARDWPGKFGSIPWVFADILRHLATTEPIRLIVSSPVVAAQAREILSKADAPSAAIEFLTIPVGRCWLRDMGPIFGLDAEGRKTVLHFQFTAWGKYKAYRRDERLPALAAESRGLPLARPEVQGRRVVLEGGAFDVNGVGDALATEECLLDESFQPRNPGWTRGDYERMFAEWLGAPNVLWLGRGIAGDEDTHGHVDDIARFVNRRTIAVCREKNAADVNYAALEENRERLRGARLADGSRPDIVELPMPAPKVFAGRRLPASYANFYIGNDRVLVPTFNDPADRIALGALAELFPDREVVGIHAGDLVLGLGAVHCLVHEEPAAAGAGAAAANGGAHGASARRSG